MDYSTDYGVMMYDSGTKQSARCWCWNQVEQRVPKNSLVMVLIDDTDFELKEGIRRGFRVVGIDKSKQSIEKGKASGGIAVRDDFINQMESLKPDAAIFDGVSGITKYAMALIDAARYTTRAVVWNGLRGRDKYGGMMKSSVERSEFKIHCYKKGKPQGHVFPGLHRGMLLYSKELVNIIKDFDDLVDDFPFPYEEDPLKAWSKPERIQYLCRFANDVFMRHHKPEFMSYRSKDSGQYFDAAAWTQNREFFGRNDLDWRDRSLYESAAANRSLASKRKSAAAKALLTMRSR